MSTIRQWFEHPAQRRKAITLTSGLLIAVALFSGEVLAQTTLRHALMIAAAVIAGSDIAGRAWNALRHRHVSIELLVTIATVGALAIGEYWEAAAVTFLFMLGAYLEARTLNQTAAAAKLCSIRPASGWCCADGQQVEVLAYEVCGGRNRAGQAGRIPSWGGTVAGHRE